MSVRSASFRIFRSSKKEKDGRAHMLYGMASAGTVAWVMYQKFCNGLPYYRQEKDWKQYGVEITRATMANWVIRNSEAFFLPMYEYFHRKLLERGSVMADETPLGEESRCPVRGRCDHAGECGWQEHGGSDEPSVFGVPAGCVSEFEIYAMRPQIFWRWPWIQVDILAWVEYNING